MEIAWISKLLLSGAPFSTFWVRDVYFLSVLLLSGPLAFGHAGHEARVAHFTEQLDANPKDVESLFLRGDENRDHGNYKEAIQDFDAILKIDPNNSLAHLGKGLSYRDLKKYSEGKKELDLFLKANPEHGLGYIYRARLEVQLKQFEAAKADFRKGIDLLQPDPDYFLEFAQAHQAGKTRDSKRAALAVLDEGASKLGSPVSLALPAVELETALGNYPEAIRRLDKLMELFQRKERWFLMRARILMRAGKFREAEDSAKKAIAALEALPGGLQSQTGVLQIRRDAERILRRGAGK